MWRLWTSSNSSDVDRTERHPRRAGVAPIWHALFVADGVGKRNHDPNDPKGLGMISL
jgi:hypothetical protein